MEVHVLTNRIIHQSTSASTSLHVFDVEGRMCRMSSFFCIGKIIPRSVWLKMMKVNLLWLVQYDIVTKTQTHYISKKNQKACVIFILDVIPEDSKTFFWNENKNNIKPCFCMPLLIWLIKKAIKKLPLWVQHKLYKQDCSYPEPWCRKRWSHR